MLPNFKRLESHSPASVIRHGNDGPIQVTRAVHDHSFGRAFLRAGQQAGYSLSAGLNSAQRKGFGAIDLTVGKGRRFSASSAYLRPVMRRRNLTIMTHTTTRRVQFAGTRATDIFFTRDGAEHVATARREVILRAKANNTPHLLMLSGVGPAARLARHGLSVVYDLSCVGQGLQDHLAAHVKYRSIRPYSPLRYLNSLHGALAMGQYLLTGTGPLADPGMSVACFVKSDPALDAPDIKMLLVSALLGNNGWRIMLMHRFHAHINVARPEARNSVTLASADPDTPPVIDQNYNAT